MPAAILPGSIMRARNLAYLQLTAAMITVGSTVIASRIIGQGIDPFLATALRFAVALPIFVILMRTTRTAFPAIGWRDGALLIGQAATGSVGYTVLLIAGTKITSAADAGIIVGTLPAAAAITAVVLLGERLSKRTAGAVALATTGVLMVISAPALGTSGRASPLGDLLVLGAVFCECIFILLNKRLSHPWPPLALSAAMAGLGLLISAPFGVLAALHGHLLPIGPLLAVVYYALIPTVAGFWLWYSGSARLAGGEVAVFTAVAPVSGVLLAWLFLGDPLTDARIAGLVAVLTAVAVTAIPARSSRERTSGSPAVEADGTP